MHYSGFLCSTPIFRYYMFSHSDLFFQHLYVVNINTLTVYTNIKNSIHTFNILHQCVYVYYVNVSVVAVALYISGLSPSISFFSLCVYFCNQVFYSNTCKIVCPHEQSIFNYLFWSYKHNDNYAHCLVFAVAWESFFSLAKT